MAKTTDNLQQAFAGESQANRKYLFFADKAEEEGQKQIARLFRAAAEAETVHARNHLRVLQGIKSTKDNLSAAISGEHHEFTQMYPGFIKEAEGENQTSAKRSFDLANQVEKTHHGLFEAALGNLNQGKGHARAAVLRLPGMRAHRGGIGSGQVPRLRSAGQDVQEGRVGLCSISSD